MTDPGVRIDKWLWATRLFKTRPLAAEACQGDHVKIDGRNVKPARIVRPGDVIRIRRPDIVRTVAVKRIVGKRIPAKEVEQYVEDLTPPAEYERQKHYWRDTPAKRARGSGRPTKKERRETDRFFGP